MRIKTYLVPTLTEAIERIKRELGPDAVILSTKKMNVQGGWWKGGKMQLEVTAAIDAPEEVLARSQSRESTSSLDQTLKLINKVTEDKLTLLRQEVSRLREAFVPGQSVQNDQGRQKKAEKVADTFWDELGGQLAGSETPSLEQVDRRQEKGQGVLKTCRTLLDHQVDGQLVQDLSNKLLELNQGSGDMREDAAQILMKSLPSPQPYDPIRDSRIVALMGPTGSGKTTTLVKLASALALEHGKSIGFITIDHFKVGGEEQIRKYAQILQAPCHAIERLDQFNKALESMADKDVILIDTIGRSPNDHEGISSLTGVLNRSHSIWKSLVVPATLRGDDLKKTIQSFSPAGTNRVIVTKLDETRQFGTLYNASALNNLPLAYFTMGQNVPEDMEVATKERVIDCLFNFSGLYPQDREELESSFEREGSFQGGDLL